MFTEILVQRSSTNLLMINPCLTCYFPLRKGNTLKKSVFFIQKISNEILDITCLTQKQKGGKPPKAPQNNEVFEEFLQSSFY